MHVIPVAKSFGMKIIAYDLQQQPEAAEQLGFQYVPLEKLLRRSDVISLHCQYTPNNRHMLNRTTFSKCRRGVIIVNTARGELIDTAALIEALDAGVVAGAGLDVIEQESILRAEAEDIIGSQIMRHVHAASVSAERGAPSAERIQELQILMRNNALLSRKRVIFTPHCAFNTVEAVEKINCTTVANIRAYLRGKPANLCGRTLIE
jgi:D-lactate dehydrogenase